jgi:hypothetical protein
VERPCILQERSQDSLAVVRIVVFVFVIQFSLKYSTIQRRDFNFIGNAIQCCLDFDFIVFDLELGNNISLGFKSCANRSLRSTEILDSNIKCNG